MEELLKRLFQIEEASVRMIERTERRKEVLKKENEEAGKAFDRSMDAENEQYIEDLKRTLAAERDEKLSDVRTGTEERINTMKSAFAAKKETLAKELFLRVLEE